MTRIDYDHQPNAPQPTSLRLGAATIVTDGQGRIVLQQRRDSGSWSTPGGIVELGESVTQAAIRETQEEVGLVVEPVRLIGIYTDPGFIHAYADGEVRQECAVLIECHLIGGALTPGDETSAVGWFSVSDLENLQIQAAVRRRLRDFFAGRTGVLD